MQHLPTLSPRLLKICSQNVQTYGYVFHDANGLMCKHLKIQWYLLTDICMVIHEPGSCAQDNSKKLYLNLDGRKYQIDTVCSFIENKDDFCPVYVDAIKMAGKKQKKLMKDVDVGENSFLDHVYLMYST